MPKPRKSASLYVPMFEMRGTSVSVPREGFKLHILDLPQHTCESCGKLRERATRNTRVCREGSTTRRHDLRCHIYAKLPAIEIVRHCRKLQCRKLRQLDQHYEFAHRVLYLQEFFMLFLLNRTFQFESKTGDNGKSLSKVLFGLNYQDV